MRGAYFAALEHASPLAVKVASVAASSVLVLLAAIPILAVGVRIFA